MCYGIEFNVKILDCAGVILRQNAIHHVKLMNNAMDNLILDFICLRLQCMC